MEKFLIELRAVLTVHRGMEENILKIMLKNGKASKLLKKKKLSNEKNTNVVKKRERMKVWYIYIYINCNIVIFYYCENK